MDLVTLCHFFNRKRRKPNNAKRTYKFFPRFLQSLGLFQLLIIFSKFLDIFLNTCMKGGRSRRRIRETTQRIASSLFIVTKTCVWSAGQLQTDWSCHMQAPWRTRLTRSIIQWHGLTTITVARSVHLYIQLVSARRPASSRDRRVSQHPISHPPLRREGRVEATLTWRPTAPREETERRRLTTCKRTHIKTAATLRLPSEHVIWLYM